MRKVRVGLSNFISPFYYLISSNNLDGEGTFIPFFLQIKTAVTCKHEVLHCWLRKWGKQTLVWVVWGVFFCLFFEVNDEFTDSNYSLIFTIKRVIDGDFQLLLK